MLGGVRERDREGWDGNNRSADRKRRREGGRMERERGGKEGTLVRAEEMERSERAEGRRIL